MKKTLIALLLALSAVAAPLHEARADVKITQLPLGTAAAVTTADVFPYVDVGHSITKKMTLDDLVNLPAMVATYATVNNPVFTGTITAPTIHATNVLNVGTAASGDSLHPGVFASTFTNPSGSAIGLLVGDQAVSTVTANANQFFGIDSQPIIGATNNKNWTSSSAPGLAAFSADYRVAAGATGVVTKTAGLYIQFQNGASGTTVTSNHGVFVENAINSGALTGNAGVTVVDQTGGTNNTDLLIGTGAVPSGAWSIYSSPNKANSINGTLRLGSNVSPTTTLDVTGAALISSTLGVTGAISTASTATATNGFVGGASTFASVALSGGQTVNRVQVLNGSAILTSTATSTTQIEYLSSVTGTTGTATSNIVFSANPTFAGTAAFATITTSANATIGTGTGSRNITINGANSGTGGGANFTLQNGGAGIFAVANYSAIFGGTYDATPTIYANTGPLQFVVNGSTAAVTISASGLGIVGATAGTLTAFDGSKNLVSVSGLGASGNIISSIGTNAPIKLNALVGSGAVYVQTNLAGAFPNTATGLAIGNNFSGGSSEVDFFNTVTTGTDAYRFYQQTGAGAATLLFDITTAGATLTGKFTANAGAVTQAALFSTTGANSYLSFTDTATSSATRVQIGSNGNNFQVNMNSTPALTIATTGTALFSNTLTIGNNTTSDANLGTITSVSNSQYYEGTFTATFTGGTTNFGSTVTAPVTYVKSGKTVTLTIPFRTGACGSGAVTKLVSGATDVPSALRPAATEVSFPFVVTNNATSAATPGAVQVTTGGAIQFYKDWSLASNWTSTAVCGWGDYVQVTYITAN